MLERGGHHAGAGDAHVDDGVGLAGAVHGAGHEGGVLDHVGENHELRGTHGVLVGGEARCIEDRLRHHEHGIHVDASAQARHVHARAHAARVGKGLGNALDEPSVGVADALLHEGRESAKVIDAEGLGSAVERVRERGEVLFGAARGDLRHRGNRDALVHDGNAVFALEALGRFHQMLGGRRHVVVDLGAHAAQILIGAAHERDAHGHGANVQMLLRDHAAGFGDFCRGDSHRSSCLPFHVRLFYRGRVLDCAEVRRCSHVNMRMVRTWRAGERRARADARGRAAREGEGRRAGVNRACVRAARAGASRACVRAACTPAIRVCRRERGAPARTRSAGAVVIRPARHQWRSRYPNHWRCCRQAHARRCFRRRS